MIQSTIETLGVFTFVCLAAFVAVPLVAYVFHFWFGFFHKVRKGREAIRKLRDTVKNVSGDEEK